MNSFICLSCFKQKPYAEREFFRPEPDHEKMICADCALILGGRVEPREQECWEHG